MPLLQPLTGTMLSSSRHTAAAGRAVLTVGEQGLIMSHHVSVMYKRWPGLASVSTSHS